MIDIARFVTQNIVLIKWLDHSTPGLTWYNVSELEDSFINDRAETMVTVGWIAKETDDRYLVISTVCVDGSPGELQVGDVNFILKSAVTEIMDINGKNVLKVQRNKGSKRVLQTSTKKKRAIKI